jgi:hypothetical protein
MQQWKHLTEDQKDMVRCRHFDWCCDQFEERKRRSDAKIAKWFEQQDDVRQEDLITEQPY